MKKKSSEIKTEIENAKNTSAVLKTAIEKLKIDLRKALRSENADLLAKFKKKYEGKFAVNTSEKDYIYFIAEITEVHTGAELDPPPTEEYVRFEAKYVYMSTNIYEHTWHVKWYKSTDMFVPAVMKPVSKEYALKRIDKLHKELEKGFEQVMRKANEMSELFAQEK